MTFSCKKLVNIVQITYLCTKNKYFCHKIKEYYSYNKDFIEKFK